MFYRKLISSYRARRAREDSGEIGKSIPDSKASHHSSLENGSEQDVEPTPTALAVHQKQQAPSRASDPLGLTLLYSPGGNDDSCCVQDILKGGPIADMIFIHGLGGSSRLTWCMRHDLDLFWPLGWLPSDPDVRRARIFTFGYNADFRSSSQSPTLGISDFSKSLLFDMLYGRDHNSKPFNLGQRPIVFITHSMGGLVFKKAYLDSQLDETYAIISRSIKAVVFLATPHRGSDLSESLNRLLSASLRHPKQYVTELSKNGFFLKTINEQFRHVVTHLQIFSFYETLKTSIGLSSTMILYEDSAKLDYPGEISRPLNADHHGVCKFDTPEDPNYKAILAILKSLTASYSDNNEQSLASDMEVIRSFLDVPEDSESDLNHFWGRRSQGTCGWILEQPQILSWTSSSPAAPEILWLTGRPGRGKSVLSAFLVHHLREKGAAVQHFFFRAGNKTKGTVEAMLRYLAFQIAAQIPSFRKSLVKLARGGYKPNDADWRAVWKKLYLNMLFKVEPYVPLYWIIDSLDESSSSQLVFELLTDIPYSTTPIHVLVTSRSSPAISATFDRISSRLQGTTLSIDQNYTDIYTYVEEELRYLSWDPSVKAEVKTRILDQANGNFLWVHLVIEEIKGCHSVDDVKATLSELPPGMEPLYQRMEKSIIERIKRPFDQMLSHQLFLWATYARLSISVEELRSLIEADFRHILDLESTIGRLCGHFLIIEGDNRVGLIHQTAREYLMSTGSLHFSLNGHDANNELFEKSLCVFMDKRLRSRLSDTAESNKYLQYRATSWMYHLNAFDDLDASDSQLDTLIKFFSDNAVLTWIQVLALLGQLNILIEAARRVEVFVKRKQARNHIGHRAEELHPMELWCHDLLELPARFGANLSLDPASIHRCVAPLCPRNSAIHKTFATQSSIIKVQRGLPEDWDDCLTRVSVGNNHPASLLSCSGRYLALVDRIGTIFVWDCATFHLVQTISHGEVVSRISFSAGGDRIATYGSRTTKVWDPQSGRLVCSIDNPLELQALFLEFINGDASLMVGSDRRRVLQASLLHEKEHWSILNKLVLDDTGCFAGTFLNSPTTLALSPDHSKIAAIYLRFPLAIWSLSLGEILMRLNREQASPASPFVKGVAWHPSSEELIGYFHDNCYFKLNVIDGTYHEFPLDQTQWPSDIRVSPNGTAFAISTVHGSIRVYDYQTCALLCQILSEGTITTFCFSQDGHRLYDIQQSSCSIWDPDALLKMPATTKESYVMGRKFFNDSDVYKNQTSDIPRAVTMLVPIPIGSLTIVADDDGLIEVVDYESGCRDQVDHIASRVSIEHLVWSEDNCHFAYSEVGGHITVVLIEPTTPSGWKTSRIARLKPERQHGGILQLLLSPDSTSLLLVFPHSVQLWSVEHACLRASLSYSPVEGFARWSTHPQSPSYLLSIEPTICIIYNWETLEESARCNLSRNKLEKREESSERPYMKQIIDGNTWEDGVTETVEGVVTTHFKTHLLLTISRRTSHLQLHPYYMILCGNIGLNRSDEPAKVETMPIPVEAMDQIDIPLNILKNGRLVFLDRTLRICTWQLKSATCGGGYSSIKRHFFIPRDWISSQSTSPLLHVTSRGTVLCHLKRDIAVINSTIGAEW